MNYTVHEETYRGMTIKIMPDEINHGDGPRDWDNLGTMVCWHSRYTLGDDEKKIGVNLRHYDPEAFFRWLASHHFVSEVENLSMETVWKIVAKYYLVLPLYLYDHSGITMRTSPFSCPWDSGQVGWIYVSHADIRKNWGVSRINAKVEYKYGSKGELVTERITALEAARRVLVAEVKTYDDHLTGNVYGYVVEDKDGEHVDSCWGFYPDHDDNTGYAYCLSQAREAADYHVQSEIKKHVEQVKAWIRGKVGLEHRTPAFA